MNIGDLGAVVHEACDKLGERDGVGSYLTQQIEFYSWPELFPSTSGPHGGGGGQMFTTFQVYAFESPAGTKVKVCAGIWKTWHGVVGEAWNAKRPNE